MSKTVPPEVTIWNRRSGGVARMEQRGEGKPDGCKMRPGTHQASCRGKPALTNSLTLSHPDALKMQKSIRGRSYANAGDIESPSQPELSQVLESRCRPGRTERRSSPGAAAAPCPTCISLYMLPSSPSSPATQTLLRTKWSAPCQRQKSTRPRQGLPCDTECVP